MRFISRLSQPLYGLLLIGLLSQSLVAQSDWPQWRGPDRDDLSQETGLIKNWPVGGPHLGWLFDNCGVGYSGPAIVDGRLYVMGGRDGKAQLICLDTNDGREMWHTNLSNVLENNWGDGPRSTPTVDGDFIYTITANGQLTCVSKHNGKIIWSVSMTDLGGKVPFWGYSESPLIYKNMVVCTPGGSQGTFAALNKRTGKVIWRSAELTDEAHYSSLVVMEVSGKAVGVQLLQDNAVGFDLSNGKILWSEPWQGGYAVCPTPIVRGQEAYFCSGYGAGSMMLRINDDFTHEVIYKNKVMVNHHGGVILLGDHLYGFSDRKGWTCQDFATGEPIWKDKKSLGKGAIGYADGHFYCLSEDEGEVVLIEASTDGWQERGRFTLSPQTEIRKPKGRIWVHPVIVGGRLYLRDQDLVYCYDVSSRSLASNPPASKSN